MIIFSVTGDDKLITDITENCFTGTSIAKIKPDFFQCDKIGTDMGRHLTFPKHNYYGNYCFGELLNTVLNSCYC